MHESLGVKIFRWTTIVVLTLFCIFPIYVMVLSSMKSLRDVQGNFSFIPQNLTIQPFIDMWTTVPLLRYFVNSVVVATCATVLSVVIAIFAAYAISRYRFRGRGVFTTAILITQMFPGILFLLPLFLLFSEFYKLTGIQLTGTSLGLIITYLTFSLAFGIWMLAGYFDGIPRELDEAAKVDGCGPMSALFRVVVPAARPGIIAVAIFSFMVSWGEVLFASVLTTDDNRTLAVGLQLYSTQNNVYWNQIMAAALVVSAPIVLMFLLLQRNFVAGLTAGSVK